MKRVQELPTSFLKARLRHISKELESIPKTALFVYIFEKEGHVW